MHPDELFDQIPDYTSWKEAGDWIQKGIQKIKRLIRKDIFGAPFTFLDWNSIKQEPQNPFGFHSNEYWRKFVLSVFLADLASYSTPTDQVNFERLLFVMHAFPEGFRSWWIQLSDASWWPVGYTGWYPMFEATFEIFEKSPEKLKDRMVIPNLLEQQNAFLYLFNYSVAVIFKKSDLSKALMQKLMGEVQVRRPAGLSCITVSEDGERVAKRLGMTQAGILNFCGSLEMVYTKRN